MDCLEGMKQLDENSIDAVVTDPPYELGFMGKQWDDTGIAYNIDMWKGVYRVLKPGGHLLSFGGSRTYHRMACAVEDAGFEIRDQIMWVYGSGFPKSLDISKSIDKRKIGIDRIEEFSRSIKEKRESMDISKTQADEHICGGSTMYSFFEGRKDKPLYFPNNEHYKKMKELFKLDDMWDNFVLETNEKIIATKEGSYGYQKNIDRWKKEQKITEPNLPEAKQWSGWGTALKPAHEPIVLARKPLSERTVAENVLKWGTGGLNIDGCRISLDGEPNPTGSAKRVFKSNQYTDDKIYGDNKTTSNLGRFPANFIHDGSDEVEVEFAKAGILRSGDNCIRQKEGYFFEHGGLGKKGDIQTTYGDVGSASRFFYCAKASKEERNDGLEGMPMGEPPASARSKPAEGRQNPLGEPRANFHPTVKPLSLMEYLVKLVTKEKQLVLDSFIGSGTTALACMITNRNFIGFEISKEYCDIAQRRIQSPMIRTEIQDNKVKQISIDKWI